MSDYDVNRLIVKATEKALGLTGEYFKVLLKFHLRNKYSSDIDVVSTNPEKFHKAVSELLGESSARLLESLIIDILIDGPPISEQHMQDFSTFIKRIKNGEVKIKESLE